MQGGRSLRHYSLRGEMRVVAGSLPEPVYFNSPCPGPSCTWPVTNLCGWGQASQLPSMSSRITLDSHLIECKLSNCRLPWKAQYRVSHATPVHDKRKEQTLDCLPNFKALSRNLPPSSGTGHTVDPSGSVESAPALIVFAFRMPSTTTRRKPTDRRASGTHPCESTLRLVHTETSDDPSTA